MWARKVFCNYILVGGAALALLAPLDGAEATGFRVLHSFADNGSDPFLPRGGLIADSVGNLYGTSEYGGTGTGNCVGGCGTVFMLAGTEVTVLHSFTGGSDGAVPLASLVSDGNGNLYGTTYSGGTGTNCSGGCGTVFKVAPDGTETVLHSLTSDSDGAHPIVGLIVDAAGNLYGTTLYGGGNAGTYCPEGCGIVFKVAPDGTETVLHSFTGYPSDGAELYAGLLADAAGNLYGTTVVGGTKNSGTLFKLAPDGTETILHSFKSRNGKFPQGTLIADAAGNFYGTAQAGGRRRFCSTRGCGTIFKLAPDGAFTVLHSFTGGNRDGSEPLAGLIFDDVGNLYGTTVSGGRNDSGVAFKLAPDGTLTVLHSFAGGTSDGQSPDTNLIADQAGRLYGTTAQGGTNDLGVVFKVHE